MKLRELMSSFEEVIPYTFEQLQEKKSFQKVIEYFLKGKEKAEHPKMVTSLGIPGSGKSTYYQKNKDNFNNFVFVGFDTIMEALPEYHKDLEELGSVNAFKKWELPARIVGYELLRRSIVERKNIYFDHGGTPKCHVELLCNIREIGYNVIMHYFPCDIDIAIERAKNRELITKRHTSEEIIRERVSLVEERKGIYEQIVDSFIEIK